MAGTIMLMALKRLRDPAPLSTVVRCVADLVGTSRSEIFEMVEATLEGGVEFGYVSKQNEKYSIPDIGQSKSAPAEPCPKYYDDKDDTDDDDNDDGGLSIALCSHLYIGTDDYKMSHQPNA